tara:strand:- start:1834 stop:4236 length:2403 start_codon:yes stop_codon:yes gene_type:complete
MNGVQTRNVIGFPDQLASDSKKGSKEYGLVVARAIESEWFRKESGTSRFYNNRDTYHKLRTYAMGEQSVQKYKDELAINGDISYLNLDWTPVPVIPKFVDIVVNGMQNRLYDVMVDAVDSISSNKKAMYKLKLQAEMRNKNDLMEMQQITGKDMFDQDPTTLPQSPDELELQMQLNYKDDIEIAQEKAIENVLRMNNYEQIRNKVDEDQTTLGISSVKHSFNTHDGIKVEYVDPANLIWSPTEDQDFEDCYYFGEVKNVNITELKKIDPSLSQEDIKEISKMSSKWDAYQGIRGGYKTDNFDHNTATLLYFCYKTDKNIVYKKKKTSQGGDKVLKKDDQFNPPKTEKARFEKLSKRIDVWYEGVLVLGTNYILKWDLMKNMVRPKSSMSKSVAPYIVSAPKMYRGQVDSLVKRMIPFADQIQLIHLKLQQVTAKMIPDGVYMDIDGLSSINLGNGAMYTPQEALNLYFQTGSVIGRSFTEEGEFNHGKMPIQELTSSGANAKISSLINMYNYNLGMIRSATGLNEARDGSTPDSNSLVGVQKIAALNSNTATRHILKSGINITRRVAEGITYRMSDVLEFSEFKEDFAKSIGRYSMEILKEIKELHLHDFGVYIELHPDEEERAVLEQHINTSLSQGKIDIDDAIDIRNVRNVKIASQLLKVRKKSKEKEDQKRQQENIQQQAKANQDSAMASEQAKQQREMAKKQADMELMKMESDLKMLEMDKEFSLKLRLIQEQKSLDRNIQGMQVETQLTKEKYKEDRKDKRTAKQASQQSKLIQQRQQDLDPIDFDGQDSLSAGY